MRIFAVVWLLGTCAIQFLSYEEVGIFAGVAILLLGLTHLTWLKSIGRILLIFCLAYGWCGLRLYQAKSQQLPVTLEKQNLLVQGFIQGIPEVYQDHVRFILKLDNLTTQTKNNFPSKMRVLLSWYGQPSELQPGQKWQLLVSLKRPHGLANPGSYNYELSAIQHRIGAIGYVKRTKLNFLLTTKPWTNPVDYLRFLLLQKIKTHLYYKQLTGFVAALTIGVTYPIDVQQWRILRATGTSHLMAISGLHVTLVVSLVYILVNNLWRRCEFLVLKMPALKASAAFSLIAGISYSLLAGMSISTQRALVMLGVYLLLQLIKRQTQVGQALVLALLLVLLWDPLAQVSAGFWLSFGAVAFILYGTLGRHQPQGLWWQYGRVQWVVGLGLIPISLMLFQQASVCSFVANLIAIPWVSFMVVPFVMLGVVTLTNMPLAAAYILNFGAFNLKLLLNLLAILADYKLFLIQHALVNYWILASSLLGCLLLLAPKGFPARSLGIIWLLPIFMAKPPAPKLGELWMAVLDVGQGLATVIKTKNHTLVYDTGASYGEEFNMGTAVVIPYLQILGVKKIDGLVISHGDNDHSGGAQAILQNLQVGQLYTSVPSKFIQYRPIACSTLQQWQWDDIKFKFISPNPVSRYRGNNRSCVLQVDQGQRQILLPGDIEKPVEQSLIRQSKLKSDVLLAPHHGSASSSTLSFVQAVNPSLVIFSTGYLNRFGFPHASVVRRYTNLGAKTFNTADCGMVSLTISKQGMIQSKCYRAGRTL